MNTEFIIEKLNKLEDYSWKDWSLDEKKKLLEIYYTISKKEKYIFDLIYSYHGCDSWEDMFRDYEENYLREKAIGVKIAIDEINQQKEL